MTFGRTDAIFKLCDNLQTFIKSTAKISAVFSCVNNFDNSTNDKELWRVLSTEI
jgi:hypothetical protein